MTGINANYLLRSWRACFGYSGCTAHACYSSWRRPIKSRAKLGEVSPFSIEKDPYN